jgi:hypothetical protein
MKQGRIGEDLIKAIGLMEKFGDWEIVLLLLELAQFRLWASIKAEKEVYKILGKANGNSRNGQRV